MPQTSTAAHTRALAEQFASVSAARLAATTAAVVAGDWRQAAVQADHLRACGRHLYDNVVRDALEAGVNWWELGDHLSLHPQDAYEQYQRFAGTRAAPALQRPHLAVVLTAGLSALHDMRPQYGIALDDLDDGHSLARDPKVRQLRQAAQLLGDDVWITVTMPGDFEGAAGDPTEQVDVIAQWTTVVLADDELTWIREAIALDYEEYADDVDDEPEPLTLR